MKLEITKDVKQNDYSVTFNIVDKTPLDIEKLSDFGGNLQVAIGGEIPLNGDVFKVDNDVKVFPADFPFTKTFKDSQSNGKGQEYAEAYIAEITTRVQAIITTLDAKEDTFSGVEIVQL